VANRRSSSGPFESEIAFVITSKGDDIGGDIAGLTSVLEYDLKPKPPHRIHDTYYDTRGGLLRKRKTALRIRRTDENVFVSLKSNPQPLDGKGVRRIEMEAPWSQQSLARIQETLEKRRSPKSRVSRGSPWAAFASMGLRVVQERITRRVVRDILRHGKPAGRLVAELDIDSVTFLGDPKVRLFQVEIEAKGGGSMKRIQRIAEALQSSYSGFLKEWPYGKLVTGLAIQKLLKSGVLQSHLDHSRLKADAFPVIEKYIRASNPEKPCTGSQPLQTIVAWPGEVRILRMPSHSR
jgi:CYTH domain-containing protein